MGPLLGTSWPSPFEGQCLRFLCGAQLGTYTMAMGMSYRTNGRKGCGQVHGQWAPSTVDMASLLPFRADRARQAPSPHTETQAARHTLGAHGLQSAAASLPRLPHGAPCSTQRLRTCLNPHSPDCCATSPRRAANSRSPSDCSFREKTKHTLQVWC